MADPVIVDVLVDVDASEEEGFYQPCSQRKVVSNDKVVKLSLGRLSTSDSAGKSQWYYPLSLAFGQYTGKTSCQNWIQQQQCHTI